MPGTSLREFLSRFKRSIIIHYLPGTTGIVMSFYCGRHSKEKPDGTDADIPRPRTGSSPRG